MLEALRPKPFRGDVIAAGVVVLVTALWVLELRWHEDVAAGVRVVYLGVAWAFVTTMAVLAEMEHPVPRAYQSVLYLASVALALAVLVELAHVLGAAAGVPGAGALTWIGALLALHAGWFAVRRNSAACTLVGAVLAGAAALAVVGWAAGDLGGPATRWLLAAELATFLFCAVGFHDRRPRHGVAFADAGGLAALAVAATLEPSAPVLGAGGGGWGWELLVVAAAFGLIAYASVDREPGPAWLGAATLAFFVVRAGGGGGVVGWPLALLLVAGVLLVIGLRPTTPLPPPPDADEPVAPALPLEERRR